MSLPSVFYMHAGVHQPSTICGKDHERKKGTGQRPSAAAGRNGTVGRKVSNLRLGPQNNSQSDFPAGFEM